MNSYSNAINFNVQDARLVLINIPDGLKNDTYIARSLVLIWAGDTDVHISPELSAPNTLAFVIWHDFHVSLVQLGSDRSATS